MEHKILVPRTRAVAAALVKMHSFRNDFGGRPISSAGELEVEDEERQGFEDASRFLDGL